MHLQKQQSRVYKGKEYPKYLIVIPPKDIEALGWNEKDRLMSTVHVKEGRLIIERMGDICQTIIPPDADD